MQPRYGITAACVAVLLATPCRAEVNADPGQADAAGSVCIACHSADGNGVAPNVPRLLGQSADYLLKQLKDYKDNKRLSIVAAHKLATLTSADMARFVATFGRRAAPPAVAAEGDLITKGKKLFIEGNRANDVPPCASCHGPAGAGTPSIPRLAGQHSEYTLDQIRQFASGGRKNDAHLCQGIVAALTEEEAQAVAQYLASIP